MTGGPPKLWQTLVALALVSMFLEQSALACSVACWSPRVLPTSAARVPANFGGFLVAPGVVVGNDPTFNELRLVDSTGSAVNLTRTPVEGLMLFRPELTLPIGSYTLLGRACDANSSAVDSTRAIEIVDALPFPTSIGSFAVERELGLVYGDGPNGACFVELRAAKARLSLTASASLVPWLPLVRFNVRVDGQPWAGLGEPGGRADALTLSVFCDSRATGQALSQGEHRVSVTALIPGTEVTLTEDLTVSLECPGGTSDAVVDAAQTVQPAQPPRPEQDPAPAFAANSSCASGGRRHTGVICIAVAGLAISVLARRRRRS